jgi:ABC-2 type transport system permease protein
MSRLGSLVRAGLKSNFGLAIVIHRIFKEKKDRWYIPLVALGVLGLLPALYGYLRFIRIVFDMLQPLGQERTILTFGILLAQFLILIFGLYYVVSAFYFSRDLEMLIALPFKPVEVMLSKFAVVLVNEYLTMIAVLLPIFISYGVLARSGPVYWLSAAAVYLLLPVIPLALVSLLVVGMMRLVNFSRKKDLMILVGSLVLIVAGMGFQFFVNRTAAAKLDVQGLTGFFTSPNSLLTRIGSGFPPAIWATKALAGGTSATTGLSATTGSSAEGLANLGLLVGVSLVLLYGMLAAAERLFYRGLIGIGEISGRRKALSRGEISRRTADGRRAVRAVFEREWRIMNRTPIFLLNGVLTAAVIPLVFLLMARVGRGGATDILKALGSGKAMTMILGGAVFMIVSGCLNGTASSTFSREGSQFWMSKVIPVSAREQVAAKFVHSYLIALLGFAAATVVLALGLGMKGGVLAVAGGLALVGGVALTAVGMIIDLARPLLDWTNPMKAIKQNLNVLFAFFADLGVLTIVGTFAYFMNKVGVGGPALIALIFAALALASFASVRFLLAFAERRYRQIDI